MDREHSKKCSRCGKTSYVDWITVQLLASQYGQVAERCPVSDAWHLKKTTSSS
jgi:hypothetical protein